MTSEILAAANIQARRARFLKPPEGTYAVFFEDKSVDAADRVTARGVLPAITTHDVRVELYEPSPDDAAEAAFEEQLRFQGLNWDKTDRQWLQDTQRYLVTYSFSFFTK